jgi:hypothetical protein
MNRKNCAKINSQYADLLRLRNDLFALAWGGWDKGNVSEGKELENKIREAFDKLAPFRTTVEYLGKRMHPVDRDVLQFLVNKILGARCASDPRLSEVLYGANRDAVKIIVNEIQSEFERRIICEGGNLIHLDLSRINGPAVRPELGNLINLKSLDLSFNDISENSNPWLLEVLENLRNLEFLDLKQRAVGLKPETISRLKKRMGENFIY